MDELEVFKLEDGSEVKCGLLLPTPEQQQLTMAYPTYSSNYLLEDKDIEKSLKGDTYKTFRRIRAPWITNQANLGACNPFSEVNAEHNSRGLMGLTHVPLSPHYTYMNINGGRDQGSAPIDAMKFSEGGIAPKRLLVNGKEQIFPAAYNTRQVAPAILKAAEEARHLYRSFEAFRLPIDDPKLVPRYIASALARDHQVCIAVHVGQGFSRLSNGYCKVARGPGNHAVILHSAKYVGGQDIVHGDLENSWGPSVDPIYGPVGSGWGEGGFGLITMSDIMQCIRYHTFWVYVSNVVNKEGLR